MKFTSLFGKKTPTVESSEQREQREAYEIKYKAEKIAHEEIIKKFPYGTAVTIDCVHSFYHGQKGIIVGKNDWYHSRWLNSGLRTLQTFSVALPDMHESVNFDCKKLKISDS